MTETLLGYISCQITVKPVVNIGYRNRFGWFLNASNPGIEAKRETGAILLYEISCRALFV